MRQRKNQEIPLDWLALTLLLGAVLARALILIDIEDIGLHLATARHALSGGFPPGAWPATNLFSSTHPDYPLYVQYPLYQLLVHAVHSIGGWSGLTILHCTLWIGVFGVWVSVAGGMRKAARLHLIWCVALLGVYPRMMLRPEVLGYLLLGILLFLLFRLKEVPDRRHTTSLLLVLCQLALTWSHPLFFVGLYFLGCFLVDALLSCQRDSSQKTTSIAIGRICIVSFLCCFCTPLGTEILRTPARLAQSLEQLTPYVGEFQPVYSSTGSLWIFSLCTLLALYIVIRPGKDGRPLPLLLLIATGYQAFGTVRGVALFSLITVALFCRRTEMLHIPFPPRLNIPSNLGIARFLSLPMTITLALSIIGLRINETSSGYGLTQPGIGRVEIGWPSTTLTFLKKFPPPGDPIHVSWRVGLWILYELSPTVRPFVDTRLQSYPPEHLLHLAKADHDPEAFAELLSHSSNLWFIDEIGFQRTYERVSEMIASKEWEGLCLDGTLVILIRRNEATKSYLNKLAETEEYTKLCQGPLSNRSPEEKERLKRMRKALL